MTKKNKTFRKKKYQLKYQLIFTFVIILTLPTLFMQTATYFFTRVIMNKEINTLVEANLSKSKQNIDLEFKNYIAIIGSLSSSHQIINNLHSINKSNKESTMGNEIGAIKEELYLEAFRNTDVKSVTVIARDSTNITYNKKDLDFNPEIYETICNEAKEVPTTIGGIFPYDAGNKAESYIYIARKIMDLNTLEYVGTVIVSIDPKSIYELSYNHEAPAYATNFIISPKKQIIISHNKRDMGQYIFNDTIEKMLNDKMQYHSMQLRYFEWELVWFVDQTLVMKELTYLGYVTLMINIIFLIGMIVSVILVSNHFIKPIPHLIKAMKQVQSGNFDIRIPVLGNNEIGEIEETFNYMTSRIHKLIKNNTKQYEQLIIATKEIKESEIKVLESQINPHFLYNTLDSINWMAIEKEEYEISLMLNNLAKILRYTIRNINRIVTVKDEIDWLEQYLYLQKQRFIAVFDYKIEAKPEIYSYRIYKLLIQPLIENAIIHGFEGYKKGGELKIVFEIAENDYIRIQIIDNGNGIKQESMKRIQDILEETDVKNTEEAIGIANVVNRVRLYYGEGGEVLVHSNENGTIFTLNLPNIRD